MMFASCVLVKKAKTGFSSKIIIFEKKKSKENGR